MTILILCWLGCLAAMVSLIVTAPAIGDDESCAEDFEVRG